MKKNISLIASIMLFSASSLLAESSSIKDAFKNGSFNGDITLYTTYTDEDGENKEGFTAGTVGLNYETDSFLGFKLLAGFRAGHEFDEQEEGNYEDDFLNDSLMHTAAISYANEDFFVSIGRQEIDLTWMGDYNESLMAQTSIIPNTTLTFAYVDRQAEAEEDEIGEFEELNLGGRGGDPDYVLEDGTYVLEIVNNSFKGFEITPYYYNIPDAVDFYGLKTNYTIEQFEFLAHYANSNVDSKLNQVLGAQDGYVLHLEGAVSIAPVTLALGYINTDEDGGIGRMDAFGENIDPTEELDDEILDEADSTTLYGIIEYEMNALELEVLYADVEYGANNLDANELSFSVEYKFTDEFSVESTFSDVEKNNVDTEVFSAAMVYSF